MAYLGLRGNPQGAIVIYLGTAISLITTLAVGLRLVARWKSKAKFAIDDVMVVLSLIPVYAMEAVGYISEYEEPPEERRPLMARSNSRHSRRSG